MYNVLIITRRLYNASFITMACILTELSPPFGFTKFKSLVKLCVKVHCFHKNVKTIAFKLGTPTNNHKGTMQAKFHNSDLNFDKIISAFGMSTPEILVKFCC